MNQENIMIIGCEIFNTYGVSRALEKYGAMNFIISGNMTDIKIELNHFCRGLVRSRMVCVD